jgi:phosphoribosyl-AMP cyclohydrolase / phosphoribosyl-ATP pyrophosphohydrolase
MSLDLDALDFAKGGGLVTVVTIDDRTGRVLMVAYADREALELTKTSGEMHYRSRTRGLWHKGATSGNTQRFVSFTPDCDGDTVLARVVPAGPACHTGAESCFDVECHREGPAPGPLDPLARLDTTIMRRSTENEPGKSYTRRLLDDANLRLKKIGEEAAELVHAAALGQRERAVEEAADLIYHTLVTLRAMDAGLDDVAAVLAARATPSS